MILTECININVFILTSDGAELEIIQEEEIFTKGTTINSQ